MTCFFPNNLIQEVYTRAGSLMATYRQEHRWGQALFEALAQIHPNAAARIAGTPADPYYVRNRSTGPVFDAFYEFLENLGRTIEGEK